MTVPSRKCLYHSTGLPAANSATRLGWNPRKRADTAGYGITPKSHAMVSLVQTALRNQQPTTTRSSTIQPWGAIMRRSGGRERSPGPERGEEPLTDQPHHRRQEDARHEARERQWPAEQRGLVRERPDRAHQRLGGQQRDERPRGRPVLEEIGGDGEEHVRAARHREAGRPADEDAAPQVLAAEPAHEDTLGQQDVEQSSEKEAQEQLEPHAAHEPPARGEPAQ